jgi:hypothetical protein
LIDSKPANAPPTTSNFAETHCAICAAGWTRTSEAGKTIRVCLLDRERISPMLTGCDRFKLRKLEDEEDSDL